MVINGHLDLVVPGVRVEEAERLGASDCVDDLVDPREDELILKACGVEVGVVDAEPPGTVFLLHQDWICQPFGALDESDEAGVE